MFATNRRQSALCFPALRTKAPLSGPPRGPGEVIHAEAVAVTPKRARAGSGARSGRGGACALPGLVSPWVPSDPGSGVTAEGHTGEGARSTPTVPEVGGHAARAHSEAPLPGAWLPWSEGGPEPRLVGGSGAAPERGDRAAQRAGSDVVSCARAVGCRACRRHRVPLRPKEGGQSCAGQAMAKEGHVLDPMALRPLCLRGSHPTAPEPSGAALPSLPTQGVGERAAGPRSGGPGDGPGAPHAHTALAPGSRGPALAPQTVWGGAASEGASRPPLPCEAGNVPECRWAQGLTLQRRRLRRPRGPAPGDTSPRVGTDPPRGSGGPGRHQSRDRNRGTFRETLASDTQQRPPQTAECGSGGAASSWGPARSAWQAAPRVVAWRRGQKEPRGSPRPVPLPLTGHRRQRGRRADSSSLGPPRARLPGPPCSLAGSRRGGTRPERHAGPGAGWDSVRDPRGRYIWGQGSGTRPNSKNLTLAALDACVSHGRLSHGRPWLRPAACPRGRL